MCVCVCGGGGGGGSLLEIQTFLNHWIVFVTTRNWQFSWTTTLTGLRTLLCLIHNFPDSYPVALDDDFALSVHTLIHKCTKNDWLAAHSFLRSSCHSTVNNGIALSVHTRMHDIPVLVQWITNCHNQRYERVLRFYGKIIPRKQSTENAWNSTETPFLLFSILLYI